VFPSRARIEECRPLTPFAEVHDGCGEYEKSSKRKEQEQEQEQEKLQALTACHITWHWGVASSQHYQTKRRYHNAKDGGTKFFAWH
jgi:hypothetical protein